MRKKRGVQWVMVVCCLLLMPSGVLANPRTKAAFVKMYSQVKGTKLDNCKTCHVSVPKLNPYGLSLKTAKLDFAKVEKLDSDGDDATNLVEIQAGTSPGDKTDKPK